MKQRSHEMVTNGKLARQLGLDPKTLRKWAKRGLVPSYINRYNGYRYYFRQEVLEALKKQPGSGSKDVDRKPVRK